MNLKQNDHGIWLEPFPVRFRSLEEVHAWRDHTILLKDTPQPGTKEYDEAPYEQGFLVNPSVFKIWPER